MSKRIDTYDKNGVTSDIYALGIDDSGAAATTSLFGVSGNVGKNHIINGNMEIAQRGTAAVTASNAYPVDTIAIQVSGDTYSAQQKAFAITDALYATGGSRNYLEVDVTSVAGAGNFTFARHRIEDVSKLAGKTVTVSFWAKAAAGTPLIGFEITQSFGSGGSPSSAVLGTGQSVTLSTTWTKYSLTFDMPSISGKTLGTTANTSYTQFLIWLDAGANFNTRTGTIGQASKVVSITQVQLEEGSVATPFEQRPIGHELALCKRYFERIGGDRAFHNYGMGYAVSTTSARAILKYTEKRALPTSVTFSAVDDFQVLHTGTTVSATTNMSAEQLALKSCLVTATVAAVLTLGHSLILRGENSTDHYIDINAEL